MRRGNSLAVSAALAATLAAGVAACGSDSHAGQRADAPAKPATSIKVRSPAVVGEHIQARYTCDGQDIPPPLEWGSVPASVRSLALFLVGFRLAPGAKEYSGRVEWAVAGLSSSLHRIAAGQLPAGAHHGLAWKHRASYSLCPVKGESVHYQFEIYGLPAGVKTPAGFSGTALLRSLTAASSPTRADAHGGFVVNYKRPS